MKSSIRSKLFLIVYGVILAFIAGLILLNNTFLENFYISNRKDALVEAFERVEIIDLDSEKSSYDFQEIENEYNIKIQVLEQVEDFEDDFIWGDFNDAPEVYERVYGNRFNIPEGVIVKIIYDFNSNKIGDELDYASPVDSLSNGEYNAVIMDIQSEFDLENQDTNMIGLCVSRNIEGENDIYYILTISFQSIQDSIKIFNSFTIIVGFIFMIFAFGVMYFISYSFTNPILQINKIAQEIANLNFNNRLDIQSEDEYEALGNSINMMSSQLEQNIHELQLSNAKLAEEILHKTDVDKMRREFIASASHELKTPLSLIMGYTEALKLPDIDNQSKEEYLEIILDETNKMNNLVQELLKISQLEAGSANFIYGEVDLEELVLDTRRLFGIVFKENGITCDVESEKNIIESDYQQLQTVLTNFINNAIHHVDQNKYIKISALRNDDNIVRISVFNKGNNIPKEDIKHIWDSFYKVDKARTRAYGGQGLGLSICRTTLDILGFKYGVDNLENGVVFYFDIMLAKGV